MRAITRLLRISCFGLLAVGPAMAATPPVAASAKVYPVIFEVAHNERGELVKFELSRVIDASSGKTDPVKLDVPASFVEGARARSLQPKEAGKPDHYFTYYILDPARPTEFYIEKY